MPLSPISPILRKLTRNRHAGVALTPLVAAALGLISSVAIARLFGASARGEYALAIASVMAVAQVISLGIGEAIAVSRARNVMPRSPRTWLVTVWVVTLALGGVGALLAWRSPILAIGVGGTSAALQAAAFALAIHRVRPWALAQLIQPVAVLVSVVIAAQSNGAIETVIAAYCLAPVAAAFVLIWTVPMRVTGETVSVVRFTRLVLVVGVQRQITTTAIALIRRIDILSLGVFVSATDIGYYAVALSLADLCLLAPWALAGSILGDELEGRTRPVRKLVTNLVAITAVPLVAIAAVGWWLIPAVWGPEFTSSYAIFLALCPGVLAMGCTRGLLSKRIALGQQRAVVLRYLALLPIAIATIAVGSYLGGIWGAAGSTCLVYGLLAVAAALPDKREPLPKDENATSR